MKRTKSRIGSGHSSSARRTPTGHKAPDLQQIFIKELKDLYNAENQLVKALPKLSKAASSSELKEAFDEHLQVTQEHVNRLEQIFSRLNENPGGVQCHGMKGLITEGEEKVHEKDTSVFKDLELIAAAQKVEHYEISGYGTVRTMAETLGLDDAVNLLQQTLNEEGEADKTLTSISENLLAGQGAVAESAASRRNTRNAAEEEDEAPEPTDF